MQSETIRATCRSASRSDASCKRGDLASRATEPALADEEKEAKEEAELGVRCGQLVRAMAPIEPALTNWAAYVEVRSPASDGHLMIPDGQLMTTDRQLMTPECHLSASECV